MSELPFADLLAVLRSFVPIDDDQAAQFARYVRPRTYDRGEAIFRAGDVCHELYFVMDGLIRAFEVRGGKDVNLRLLCEPSAALAYSSFVTQTPATEDVQCLTDCRGYQIAFRRQMAELPGLLTETLRRVLAERHYLSMERRLRMLQHRSARDRYAFFRRYMEPRIVAETPDYHVASYLGITPVSLSRVKHA